MTWLLRLYPRDWRRRYGAEIEELVASQPRSMQLVVDLLGGAVDAHLKPQAFARRLEERAVDRSGGLDMVNRLRRCKVAPDVSRKESLVSASFAIAIGLLLAAYIMTDPSQMNEAIALTMFPAFLAAPMNWIWLRGHSRLARVVLFGGPFVICFLIGLTAGIVVSD